MTAAWQALIDARLALLRVEYQILQTYQQNGGSPSFSLYTAFPFQYNVFHNGDMEEQDDKDGSTSGESTTVVGDLTSDEKDWK